MDDIPIEKIQISGPTLASLLHRVSSAPGDIDGLLFGHVTQITPANLSDDDPTSSTNVAAESASLIATITSFFASTSTSSFYSSSGNLNTQSLPKFTLPAGDTLLGWFSSRRKTQLRPSMRETSFTSSLSSNTQFAFQVKNFTLCPNLFILLTTPFIDQLIHTHDYRAYQFRFPTKSFEPKTLDIVNIGPAFRGHYGNFNPHSRLPSLPCQVKGFEAMVMEGGENLESLKRVSEDQKELDKSADGFEIGRLGRLMGSNAANYTGELEDLYNKMLAKLDGLARLVEKSSARVLEQENHNMKLRHKVAGLE